MQLPELHAIRIDRVTIGVECGFTVEQVATETVALAMLAGTVILVLPILKDGKYVTVLATRRSTVDSVVADIFTLMDLVSYYTRPHNRDQVLRRLH